MVEMRIRIKTKMKRGRERAREKRRAISLFDQQVKGKRKKYEELKQS